MMAGTCRRAPAPSGAGKIAELGMPEKSTFRNIGTFNAEKQHFDDFSGTIFSGNFFWKNCRDSSQSGYFAAFILFFEYLGALISFLPVFRAAPYSPSTPSS